MTFAIRVTVAIISVVTMAMYLVCVSTDYWQTTKYQNTINHRSAVQGTHSGIWNGCFVRDHQEHCGHIHLEKHWLRAVRAFMILGLVANFVAMLIAVIALIKEEFCFRIVGFVLLANAVLIMIGLSVYAGKSGIPYEKLIEEGKFAWSFIVCWCTWLLTIIGCVISFIEDCNGETVFHE